MHLCALGLEFLAPRWPNGELGDFLEGIDYWKVPRFVLYFRLVGPKWKIVYRES